jgi:hypothetical protein
LVFGLLSPQPTKPPTIKNIATTKTISFFTMQPFLSGYRPAHTPGTKAFVGEYRNIPRS